MHESGLSPVVEQVIHIVLFLFAGLTAGLIGLAALERIGGARRVVRLRYVAAALALTLATIAAERVYHVL